MGRGSCRNRWLHWVLSLVQLLTLPSPSSTTFWMSVRFEWTIFLVQNKRVKGTTFSPAAYPPCRSYKQPRGFNQQSSRVWIGNKITFACLTIFLACIHAVVIALLETPRRSKMAWLKEWKLLMRYENVEETYTASCSYGSVHQKEFRFLTCNMRPHSLCRPCTRGPPAH